MQQSPKVIVIVVKIAKTGTFQPQHMDLVEACKRGDQKAQFELYGLYHKAMYNTALRIAGIPEDAEDIMQEAFLKAFVKLQTYKGEVSVGAWIKRIVVNKALDFLRVKKESLSLEEGLLPEEAVEEKQELDGKPSAEEVRAAIMRLPDGYRVVLSLILLEGYDHEEVSEILGISNATSRTQFHRAKKKLAEELRK